MASAEPSATDDGAQEVRSCFVVRVWMPDRPGALGHVAGRIGAVGGDVLGIDVVDRGADRAIDELTVDLAPSRVALLTREVNAVDGVDVEEVRAVPSPPGDPRIVALSWSTRLLRADSPGTLQQALCEAAASLLHADWSAVARPDEGTLFCGVGAVPQRDWLLAFSRGALCTVAEGAISSTGADGDEVAWSPLRGLDRLLVVGRDAVAFRRSETAVVAALAELAVLRLGQIDAHLDSLAVGSHE
jgi:hypothetical protein